MSFSGIFETIFSINIWTIAKILVSFALLLYVGFAFVVLKQVNLMIETLQSLSLPLRVIAALHLAVAIFVFTLALIIL